MPTQMLPMELSGLILMPVVLIPSHCNGDEKGRVHEASGGVCSNRNDAVVLPFTHIAAKLFASAFSVCLLLTGAGCSGQGNESWAVKLKQAFGLAREDAKRPPWVRELEEELQKKIGQVSMKRLEHLLKELGPGLHEEPEPTIPEETKPLAFSCVGHGPEKPALPDVYLVYDADQTVYHPRDRHTRTGSSLAIHTKHKGGFSSKETKEILRIAQTHGVRAADRDILLYAPDGVKDMARVLDETRRDKMPLPFPKVFAIKILDPL